MNTPAELPNIRNITVSGRIGSGATTLAKKLAEILKWEMLEGGQIMRKANIDAGASVIETDKRPDDADLKYEEMVKKILKEENHHIIQSHLAGFDAQAIEGVFKICVICEDEEGNDKTDIRIDRLVNRDKISVDEAKYEIKEREERNLKKWRRLYAKNDSSWIYWDKNYYDLVINTYSHNPRETLDLALENIGFKS
ncbi:MAG: cytidylate kinase family protein [Candidatus Levybacteria bacterium]|nr:cytidylate kinase family protein [Candidatus Levybacteria bacterium]